MIQGRLEAGQKAEPRTYVFLVFSTDNEAENPEEILESIRRGDGEGPKLERITVLRNPVYAPC